MLFEKIQITRSIWDRTECTVKQLICKDSTVWEGETAMAMAMEVGMEMEMEMEIDMECVCK